MDPPGRHVEGSTAIDTGSHSRAQPEALRQRKAQTDRFCGSRLRGEEGEPVGLQGEADTEGEEGLGRDPQTSR